MYKKLNTKCEKQDESERIHEARTPLINRIFVMFLLKFNSNQPKSDHNWNNILQGGRQVFGVVLKQTSYSFCEKHTTIYNSIAPPWTKIIHIFHWKRANITPI